jgi:hypothetical protein
VLIGTNVYIYGCFLIVLTQVKITGGKPNYVKGKSDSVKYKRFGKENLGINVSESSKITSFSNLATFSNSAPSAELDNMETCCEAGQNIKPEDGRYIILGNTNPDSEFRKLKELCRNLHWINVEEVSFLWRDTNSNIDIIRRYIDNTKYLEYNTKSVIEHSDRTMLLVAGQGMGKSTFLSNMAHKIKK